MDAEIRGNNFAIGSFYRSDDEQQCNKFIAAVVFSQRLSSFASINCAKSTPYVLLRMILSVWGLLAYRRRNNYTNTSYFIKSDLNRQDAIALEYCAICEYFNKLKSPDRIYIHVNDISSTAKKLSNKLRTITIVLHFGQIQCPLQDTFSACVVQFIRE
eukprot:scaffold3679_cov128-Skeletonema_menzelii.AAC.5